MKTTCLYMRRYNKGSSITEIIITKYHNKNDYRNSFVSLPQTLTNAQRHT